MVNAGALTTVSLLGRRAMARRGLLLSATATIAVAVATVCTLAAWLLAAVAQAGDAAPPGVPADEVAVQASDGVIALLSAAPALVLLVVILAGTAAAQLARLLSAAREQETDNLRARGLSRRQATIGNGIEAAGMALAGAGAGLAVAALVSVFALGSAGSVASPWWVALAAAAVLTAVVLAVVLVAASRPRRSAAGRGARVTTMAAVVVLALGAAFVIWQLRLARGSGFDPVAAVAPTVVLMAAAVLVLAVFGVGAPATAVPAAAAPGLAPAYPARQVARRLPIYAVAVLLVGLTVAQIVFASAYSSTWTAMTTDSAALRAGADLRVDLEPAAATPAVVATAASVEGVDAAAPALVVPIEIGSTDAELVAVPAAAIETVVSAAGGFVDRKGLAAAVAPARGSVTAAPLALGDTATGLRVVASVDSSRESVAASVILTATLLDANGATASLRLPGAASDAVDGVVTLTAEGALPEGTAPWRLLALTASVPASFANAMVQVALSEVRVVGADDLDVSGQAVLDQETPEQVVWLADGTAPGAEADPPPVRAVVSTALATRLGLGVGEQIEFRYAGSGRRGGLEIAQIVDAVPGAATGLAAFAPLEVLEVSMLQRGTSLVSATSVWAEGSPAADLALSAALEDRPVATAAPGVADTIVSALLVGWWIATAGSVVLSLVAAAAIAQTLALARRRELGVLRALGVPHRRQARMRAAELGAVFGVSVVLGMPAGVLVSWLIVPDLVRAVTPGILPLGTPVSLAWPGLVLAIGVLAVGLSVIVIATAVGVDRAARAATVGEDAR